LLATHPQGIIQNASNTRIIPFINKAGEEQTSLACDLAASILSRQHPKIEKVVFGEVKRPGFPFTIASLSVNELSYQVNAFN